MSQQLTDLLSELEETLKQHALWDATPPSVEALASELPFCVDTLHFQQWLQWIYIPRLKALIDAGAPLPEGGEILPYASESFSMQKLNNTKPILIIISHCDRLLNANR